jgi:hypothetical protein
MFVQIELLRLLLVAGCTMVLFLSPSSEGVAEVVTDPCGLEGSILRIGVTWEEESRFYAWSASGVELTETRKMAYSPAAVAPPGSVYALGTWRRVGHIAGVPQDLLGTNVRLDTPFAVSHDGQLLIISVYSPESELTSPPSRKIALIDLKRKAPIRTLEAEHEVRALAWAPSGKYFAVLLSQDVTKEKWKGPLDLFARLVGHPISYYSLYAATYDLDGRLLCEKRLAEKVPQGSGYVVWEAAKEGKADVP